jgi:hypothetical protein
MPRKERDPGRSYLRVADALLAFPESQEFLCSLLKKLSTTRIHDWSVTDGSHYDSPILLFAVAIEDPGFTSGSIEIGKINAEEEPPYHVLSNWLDSQCDCKAIEVKNLRWSQISTFNTKPGRVPLKQAFMKILLESSEYQAAQAGLPAQRKALAERDEKVIKKTLLDKGVSWNSRRFKERLREFKNHDLEHLDLYWKEFITSLVIES